MLRQTKLKQTNLLQGGITMGLLRSLKSWHQDRKMVSMQKHEIDYIKRLARKYLRDTEGQPDHHMHRTRSSSLRKMCKYILKTRPETQR
jgi:hypothetical protein